MSEYNQLTLRQTVVGTIIPAPTVGSNKRILTANCDTLLASEFPRRLSNSSTMTMVASIIIAIRYANKKLKMMSI